MKKIIFSGLACMMLFSSGVYAQDQTMTGPGCQDEPCTVYFKSGRKLAVDSVWLEGNTLFVVAHGKKVVVGYDVNQIDLQKSFDDRGIPTRPVVMLQEAPLLEIFEKAGLERFIAREPTAIIATRFKHEKYFPADVYQALAQAAAAAYDPARIRKAIISDLSYKFDAAYLQEKLAWYETVLGRKIAALDKLKADPAEEQAFLKQLQAAPPSRQRVELAARLNVAVGTGQQTADIAQRMYTAIQASLNAALPAERRVDAGKIKQSAEELRSEVAQSAEKEFNVRTLLYRYRTLTDQELLAFMFRFESDFEQMFYREFFTALKSALTGESERAGRASAAILLKKQ